MKNASCRILNHKMWLNSAYFGIDELKEKLNATGGEAGITAAFTKDHDPALTSNDSYTMMSVGHCLKRLHEEVADIMPASGDAENALATVTVEQNFNDNTTKEEFTARHCSYAVYARKWRDEYYKVFRPDDDDMHKCSMTSSHVPRLKALAQWIKDWRSTVINKFGPGKEGWDVMISRELYSHTLRNIEAIESLVCDVATRGGYIMLFKLCSDHVEQWFRLLRSHSCDAAPTAHGMHAVSIGVTSDSLTRRVSRSNGSLFAEGKGSSYLSPVQTKCQKVAKVNLPRRMSTREISVRSCASIQMYINDKEATPS